MEAKISITSEDLSPIQKEHIIEDLLNDIDGVKKVRFKRNILTVKYKKTIIDIEEIVEFLETLGYFGEEVED